jgi:hypothetical protein
MKAPGPPLPASSGAISLSTLGRLLLAALPPPDVASRTDGLLDHPGLAFGRADRVGVSERLTNLARRLDTMSVEVPTLRGIVEQLAAELIEAMPEAKALGERIERSQDHDARRAALQAERKCLQELPLLGWLKAASDMLPDAVGLVPAERAFPAWPPSVDRDREEADQPDGRACRAGSRQSACIAFEVRLAGLGAVKVQLVARDLNLGLRLALSRTEWLPEVREALPELTADLAQGGFRLEADLGPILEPALPGAAALGPSHRRGRGVWA